MGQVLVQVSPKLTLENTNCEIRNSVAAVARYKIEKPSYPSQQFADWCEVEARDCDRETVVRMVVCMTRIDAKVKQLWW